MIQISLAQQLDCVHRWLRHVHQSGPGWVRSGKWTQERLNQEIAELEAVARSIERTVTLEEITREMLGGETKQMEVKA